MRRQPQSIQREVFLQAALLSALFGVVAGLAIARVYTDAQVVDRRGDEFFVALVGVALIVHSVNFFHGAASVLYDDAYLLEAEARPFLRLTSLARNVGNFACLALVAGGMTNYFAVALGECLLRISDIGWLGVEVAGERRRSKGWLGNLDPNPTYAAQRRYWMLIDVLCLACLAPFLVRADPPLYERFGVDASPYRVMAVVFSFLMVLDVVIDYSVYGRRYRSWLANWCDMAERWDRLQGEIGDDYRRIVIHPFLRNLLATVDDAHVVVDAGAGNGCTARFLADCGYRVIGFDAVQRSVDIACLYQAREHREVAFVVADLTNPALATQKVLAAAGAPADVVVAVFALQDCADLAGGMETCASLLRPGGTAVVVFESAIGLSDVAPHRSTSRRLIRAGREQVITWLPVEVPAAGSVSGPDGDQLITTLTYVRSADDYTAAADAAGLQVAGGGDVDLATPACTLLELDYQRAPKFQYLRLAKPLT